MTFKRKAAGVQTDIATKAERRSAGAWVPFDLVKRRLTGAWTVVWSRISITAQNIFATRFVGACTAGYRLNTSGIVESQATAVYTTLETWLVLGSASAYEARATVTAGALSSGTAGSWLSLGTSREWTVTQSVVGNNQCAFTIEIRNATTLVVVDSAEIIIEAERT